MNLHVYHVPLLNFQIFQALPLMTVLAASSCRSRLADFVGKLVVQTSSSSGLIITLSYAMIVYQLFALGLLFLRIKVANTGVLRWSLFYVVVRLVTIFLFFLYSLIAVKLVYSGHYI